MASESLFAELPVFPDDVPTAAISTISLTRLKAGDPQTAQEMFKACQDLGFFLLDLRDDKLGDTLVTEVDKLFRITTDLMSLPIDHKMQYLNDFPRSILGYKPRGQSKTETKEPDRFEWFNLAQDGLMGNTPLQSVPEVIRSHRSDYESFLEYGQIIVCLICEALATQLHLPKSAFTSLCSPRRPSGTVIRMIRYDPSPNEEDLRTSMLHHTDFGTVTLLANILGGLQILAPNGDPAEDDAWLWVQPQPRQLIVNLGDAMVQWTGGILRSNVHRVIYAPGDQRYLERYSIALLSRAEKDASMKTLIPRGGNEDDTSHEDEDITAWDWEVKKAIAMTNGEPVLSKGGRRAPAF